MVDVVTPAPIDQMPLRPKVDPANVPLDRFNPANKVGYGDGDQNDFYAERQALVWTAAYPDVHGSSYTDAVDRLESAVQGLNRSLAEQEMASSSTAVALKEQEAAINLASTAETQEEAAAILLRVTNYDTAVKQAAEENPHMAISQAATTVLNPSLEAELRDVFAFRDYQLGTVAKRVQSRRILDWSFDNYAADFGALLPNPIRFGLGQTKFPESYYGTLHQWNALSTAEKLAQWPKIEQDAWDAASMFDTTGHNALVYHSIIAPFIDQEDEIWARLDLGLDAADTFGTLFGAVRLATVVQRTRRAARMRNAALATGNQRVAGEATARGIAQGEQEAVLEGHPVRTAEDGLPSVQPGLEVPTQSHLVRRLIAEGIVPNDATDVPIERISPLNDTEQAAAIERATLQFGAQGELQGTVRGHELVDGGFNLVIETPAIERVTVPDAMAQLASIETGIRTARTSLRRLANASADGADVTGEIAAVTNQIDALKARRKLISDSIRKATTSEAGGGPPVTSIDILGTGTNTVRKRFNWTVDDAGKLDFKENAIGLVAHHLGSQETRADNVINGITALGANIANQQRRLFGIVSEEIRSIENALSSGWFRRLIGKDEKQRVGAVLLKGDKEKRVFSDVELFEGIETPELGLVRLQQHEIDAYRSIRNLFDDLWLMLDRTQREDLRFGGFSALMAKHISKDGTVRPITIFGKARHGDISHTVPTIGANRITHALDATTGDIRDLSILTTLDDDLAAGRKGFIELKQDFIQGDGTHYKYALVDVDYLGDIKSARNTFDIPAKTLDYRQGYVPKMIADHVGFVVETQGRIVRNGISEDGVQTYRGFTSRAEAEIYVNRKVAEGNPDVKYEIKNLTDPDYKNANPEAHDFITQQLFSGAFAGHRTDGVFRIGLEGMEAGRMSAYEAIRRYADYISRHAPMHSFKQGMIKRFLENVTRSDGTRALAVKWDWSSELRMDPSNPRYRSVVAMQDWMRNVFAVPVTEERAFAKFTSTLGYALDRVIWNKIAGQKRFGAGITSWAQHKLLNSPWARDPVQQAKSFTFDMMLGMFNPVQYIVQSAGMAVPLSLHPIEGAAAMPKFLALRTLWKMDTAENAAKVAGMMGLDADEFVHTWQAYRRSGFIDSILENADFGNYVASSHGYYSPGWWKTVKEKGRIFYNMGELNNRTFAWAMAHDRLMAKNGWNPTKSLSTEQLFEVNKEAWRLSMNMNQANKARWQQGIPALPTQFMQVTARFYENMFSAFLKKNKGGKWTKTEAATAFGMSTLMFGAANWGIDEFNTQFESWLVDPQGPFGLDPEKDAATIAAARGGLVEMMAFNALGWTPDVADRLSLGSGVNMIYENLWKPLINFTFEDDASEIASMILGASMSAGSRVHKAGAAMIELFRSDIVGGQMDVNTIGSAALDLASITSTVSNANKAYLWNQLNQVVDIRTGQPFGMSPPSENPGMIFLQAVGISPLDIEKYYIVQTKVRDREKQHKELADAYAAAFRKLYTSGEVVDQFTRQRLQRTMAIALAGMSPEERAKMMQRMQKTWTEKDKIENLQKKLYEQVLGSDVDEARDAAADAAILEATKRSN